MTPWTMRQFAGHKTAKDTNERFKYLMAHGETGLSTAFDLPTLMGLDSDDPQALGEVGREGVAVDSLLDFEALFEGICHRAGQRRLSPAVAVCRCTAACTKTPEQYANRRAPPAFGIENRPLHVCRAHQPFQKG